MYSQVPNEKYILIIKKKTETTKLQIYFTNDWNAITRIN